MEISPPPAPKPEALAERRFKILEDIARELSGDVSFPTSFDLAIHLRNVLRKPDVSLKEVARVVSVEPLVSTKLLRLANCIARNPGGQLVVAVDKAVLRLGLEATRSAAFAVAIEQLRGSRNLSEFNALSSKLWTHTVRTTAAARVVARRMTRINVDEAMTAGLVHDLGAFYMLYRVAHYEEFHRSPESVEPLVRDWHESIGESLMYALGLPEPIIAAARDHDQPRDGLVIPKDLRDVVFVSNLLGGPMFEHGKEPTGELARPEIDDDRYRVLAEEIEAECQELLGVLS
jgi:HD-like signal output (HDOD) protein